MRFLATVLMITFLLLRGWTGDAMATTMALAPLQAPVAAAHATYAADAAQTAPDCTSHPAHDGAAPAAHADCGSCAACQACHSLALAPTAAQAPPVFGARTLAHATAERFASADTAHGQKPPIF